MKKAGAISLIGKNAEFREIHEYYRSRKENPLKKMQSVVAVACKDIRVFYAILTKGGLTSILHRMGVLMKNFDFKDLMAFGMFILALLTFVFTFIR